MLDVVFMSPSNVLEIRHPTLELDWLPLSVRKGLDQPRIVFTGAADCGGRYWARARGNKPILTPFHFDRREAAIIELGCMPTPATIAHEYRHHWQRENNIYWSPCSAAWNPIDDGWNAYWKEIRRYFTTHKDERDALLFEAKIAPDDINISRMDYLGWVL